MKINTKSLNIDFINKEVFPSISIVEDILVDIEENNSNITLMRKGEGKCSYQVKSKEINYYMKIWQTSGILAQLKNFIGLDLSSSEYRNIYHLRSKGVIAPEIFFFANIYEKKLITNIHITEYISTNLTALQYIKSNCSSKSFENVIHFSEKLLTLTEDILNAGIIDTDHHLANIMVNHNGDLVKIDLEMAVKKNKLKINRKKICAMYGSLIYGYIFAVQPNLELASKFTKNLYTRFELDSNSIKVTNKIVMSALELQLRKTGIDSRFDLPILASLPPRDADGLW